MSDEYLESCKSDDNKFMNPELLQLEEWSEIHEDEIDIELAESGADREMCFNRETELETRYNVYLKLFEGSENCKQAYLIDKGYGSFNQYNNSDYSKWLEDKLTKANQRIKRLLKNRNHV